MPVLKMTSASTGAAGVSLALSRTHPSGSEDLSQGDPEVAAPPSFLSHWGCPGDFQLQSTKLCCIQALWFPNRVEAFEMLCRVREEEAAWGDSTSSRRKDKIVPLFSEVLGPNPSQKHGHFVWWVLM